MTSPFQTFMTQFLNRWCRHPVRPTLIVAPAHFFRCISSYSHCHMLIFSCMGLLLNLSSSVRPQGSIACGTYAFVPSLTLANSRLFPVDLYLLFMALTILVKYLCPNLLYSCFPNLINSGRVQAMSFSLLCQAHGRCSLNICQMNIVQYYTQWEELSKTNSRKGIS